MSKKRFIPWFTILIALTCVGMHIAFVYLGTQRLSDLSVYEKLGAPPAINIYRGEYWGVFLNSFLHHKIEFLTLNLIGIISFGSFIEKRTNFYTLFLLGFIGSISTSLIQLTLSGDAGIGMTGVNFFFASYILGRSFKDEHFKMKFGLIIRLLIFAVLIWAICMNKFKGANFGTESMIAGIIFGFTIGTLVGLRKKVWSYSFALLLVFGLSTVLFYAPWALQWNLYKAYEAHEKEDYKEAKHYYFEALNITPYCSPAHNNLRIIKIEEMCEEAFAVHESGDYLRAHDLYKKIQEIDPENEWVKERIKELP